MPASFSPGSKHGRLYIFFISYIQNATTQTSEFYYFWTESWSCELASDTHILQILALNWTSCAHYLPISFVIIKLDNFISYDAWITAVLSNHELTSSGISPNLSSMLFRSFVEIICYLFELLALFALLALFTSIIVWNISLNKSNKKLRNSVTGFTATSKKQILHYFKISHPNFDSI